MWDDKLNLISSRPLGTCAALLTLSPLNLHHFHLLTPGIRGSAGKLKDINL